MKFLIDTGSDLCVFPRDLLSGPHEKSCYKLGAANGTLIATYGTTTMTFDLGLRRDFVWRFVIADVAKPIIGDDFLAYYDLLVDVKNRRLCDVTTPINVRGSIVTNGTLSVKSVTCDTPFHRLLMKFPDITRPDGVATVKHKTVHFIKIVPGPPVVHKPRRLAPDRLHAAKREFDAMLKLGIAKPSESSWLSPLHMEPKKNNEWSPCGNFRALNARTVPDRYPVRHIQDFSQTLSGKIMFSTIDLVKAFHQISSDFTIGAVLQQSTKASWEPLAFFSRKLNTFERKYSAYDRELLSIYESVKHFLYMLEARVFTIFTYHKPLTYSFQKKDHQCTPRQFRYLDLIGQYSIDISYVSGDENVVADALARIEEVESALDLEALAAAQKSDSDLKTMDQEESNLQLKLISIPESNVSLLCDVSTSRARPYVPEQFRRRVFESIHRLSHPGSNATMKMVTQRYVWQSEDMTFQLRAVKK